MHLSETIVTLVDARICVAYVVESFVEMEWTAVGGTDQVESAIGVIRGVAAGNAMKLSNEGKAIEVTRPGREERRGRGLLHQDIQIGGPESRSVACLVEN